MSWLISQKQGDMTWERLNVIAVKLWNQLCSSATSRWSRCMTWVLREASVANIARLRAVTEQTHTCINTPPSALHLVWVFHIGAVLTCMWVFCDQHSKVDKEHRFISGQVNAIKTSTISYSIVSIKASWWCSKVFLGISGSSYLGKSKQRLWVSFDNFDKPDYPLFAPAAMLTRRFISEPSFLNSTKAYLPSAGSGAYLEKDERAVWSVWGHIFICHQPELSHE